MNFTPADYNGTRLVSDTPASHMLHRAVEGRNER